MTRERAAEICQYIKFILKNEDYTEEVEEALDVAIEALQQEPSCRNTRQLDLISRQDVIDGLEYEKEMLNRVLDNMDVVGQEREMYAWGLGLVECFIEDIKELPSAEPKRGKWIEHDDETVLCECSECHEKYLLYEEHILGRNYCPNCGARLESDEE